MASPQADRELEPGTGGIGDAELAAYKTSLAGAFRAAAERTRVAERVIRLAGRTLHLRFAGDALISRVMPALAHLLSEEDGGTTVLHIWDSLSTRIEPPAAPWGRVASVIRGQVRGVSSARYRVGIEAGWGALGLWDMETGEGWFVAPSPDAVPWYECAAPLRTLLNWWCEREGLQLVHAAVVGEGGRGALIAGKGGSGKSSTALRCLLAGMSYVSDDYAILADGKKPVAHSLYSTAKVRAADIGRFPSLFRGIAPRPEGDEEKALVFLNEAGIPGLSSALEVAAVLLPRVTGEGATRTRPATAAQALLALAPSTIFQLPGAGRESFERLASFVRRIPAHALELGTDFDRIPDVVRGALA